MSGNSRGRGGFGRGFIRFQSASSSGGGAAIPPPPSLQVTKNPIPNMTRPSLLNNKGLSSLSSIPKIATKDPISNLNLRHKTEDSYFDDDEEEAHPLYLPAPGMKF